VSSARPVHGASGRGAHVAGTAADVYAFGCILYELFCGCRPFAIDERYRDARPELVVAIWERAHCEEEEQDPVVLGAGLDPTLAGLMRRCLAKHPERRPASFAELGDELRRLHLLLIGHAYPRPEPQPSRLLADTLNNRGVSFFTLTGPCPGSVAGARRRAQSRGLVQPRLARLAHWRCHRPRPRPRHRGDRRSHGRWRRPARQPFLPAAQRLGDRGRHLRAAGVSRLLGGAARAVALCAHARAAGDAQAWPEVVELLAPGDAALRTDPAAACALATALQRTGHEKDAYAHLLAARVQLGELPEDLARATAIYLPGFAARGQAALAGARPLGLAVSADGHTALSASESGDVYVWDVRGPRVIRALHGTGRDLRSVAIDPQGRWGVTAADGRPVSLWDLTSGLVVRQLQLHTGQIRALAAASTAGWWSVPVPTASSRPGRSRAAGESPPSRRTRPSRASPSMAPAPRRLRRRRRPGPPA
jgi:hypothetical protein